MHIGSRKDFVSGLLFVIVGAAFALGAGRYATGTAADMGPGYFPRVLGVLLTLLGTAITVRSLLRDIPGGGAVGKWAWRPFGHVLAANLAFGVLLGGLPGIGLPSSGMVVAIYALIVIASRAGEDFRLRDALILATVLSLVSYLGFVVLLGLPIPVWPVFAAA